MLTSDLRQTLRMDREDVVQSLKQYRGRVVSGKEECLDLIRDILQDHRGQSVRFLECKCKYRSIFRVTVARLNLIEFSLNASLDSLWDRKGMESVDVSHVFRMS
jgi:hypothetical protein